MFYATREGQTKRIAEHIAGNLRRRGIDVDVRNLADKQELEEYDVITGDTEGIVNYALSITGIRLAAFIVERSDKVKLSLRSRGEFPANEICKKYFNGGGHRNAAGGVSTDSLDNVINQFKQILPEYKKLLIQ